MPRAAPLYSRVQQALRERVAAGEWRPGDRIPTIRELGQAYGVSHITVVQALDELSREGLLTRMQGKGIFISEPRTENGPLPLLSFTEETRGRGGRAGSRLLRLAREPADAAVAARFGVPVGEPLVILERVRLIDDEPVGLQRALLPQKIVPGLSERSEPIESLYQLLVEQYGVLPTRASESYTPVQLDDQQARMLEARAGAAAFEVERWTTDQHGRTIECLRSVFRGDRYQLLLRLARLAPL